jgi:hypothetical protein
MREQRRRESTFDERGELSGAGEDARIEASEELRLKLVKQR